MDADLAAIVRRENPWLDRPGSWPEAVQRRLPDPFVPRLQRDVVALDDRPLPRDKATLLIGPRQAGKSSWIWHRLRELGPGVLFVDCELHRFRSWCADPGAFLGDVAELVASPSAIYLDEIQHLDEAGLFLKGLVDRRPPCPILATGSSSYHLRAKTRESLAGRARRARLFPFSLDEITADVAAAGPAVRASVRRERFARHAIVGGFPAAWLGERPDEELAGLLEAVVIRDASDLYRIQRPDAFRSLLALAARQAGNLVNLSEWASLTGVSVPTVASYLDIMEESHLLVRLPIYAGGRRSELTQAPKVYFVDSGLRNRLVGDFSELNARADRGAVVESWLFSELWKSLPHAAPLRFWRTRGGAEVDFVIGDADALIAVEVKAAALRRPSLGRGARSFIEAYRPRRFLVANTALEHVETIEGCTVEWLHVTDVVDRALASLG